MVENGHDLRIGVGLFLLVDSLHGCDFVDQRLSDPPAAKGCAKKTPDLRECRGLVVIRIVFGSPAVLNVSR